MQGVQVGPGHFEQKRLWTELGPYTKAGHESQVRINDISVSRCHAIIKCKQDGFYIEDNTSKFGTIILLKNKLRLKAHHTMAVQVGRTVISFTIKYV